MEIKTDLKSLDLSGIKSFLLNFLVPLGCLVGVGVLAFVVLLPSYRKIPSLEKQLATKTALSRQLNQKTRDLNELVDFKPLIEENSTLVNRTLVSEALIPELLAQVDRMVRESGMEVAQLSYSGSGGSGKGAGAYNSVGVALSTRGSYGGLLSFMDSVEKASRLVVVKDFRYTSSDNIEYDYSASFQLFSPYLSVESDAVTDEPVPLKITDKAFLSAMEQVAGLRHYEISAEDIQPELLEEVPESSPSESSSSEEAPPEDVPSE